MYWPKTNNKYIKTNDACKWHNKWSKFILVQSILNMFGVTEFHSHQITNSHNLIQTFHIHAPIKKYKLEIIFE